MLGTTAVLRSLISTAPIMRKSSLTETARTMIKVARALTMMGVTHTLPGVSLSLICQHNDLETLPLGEGHNHDRDRPLFLRRLVQF